MRGHLALIVAALLLAAAAGSSTPTRRATEPRAVWYEVTWPFPMDQWGQGKAYRCKSADCGSEIALYVRPKLGFCDCAAGIADDEALDRMSDFDLVGGASPLGFGRPILVGHMQGRSRAYALTAPGRFGKSAISIAFNDRCDMVVATALHQDWQTTVEPGIMEFLNSETVQKWVDRAIGL